MLCAADKCVSLRGSEIFFFKAPEKAQQSGDFSHTKNKWHSSARIGLGFFGMHCGNGTKVGLRNGAFSLCLSRLCVVSRANYP